MSQIPPPSGHSRMVPYQTGPSAFRSPHSRVSVPISREPPQPCFLPSSPPSHSCLTFPPTFSKRYRWSSVLSASLRRCGSSRRLDRGHDVTENVLVLALLRPCTDCSVVGTVGSWCAGSAACAVAECRAPDGAVELYLAPHAVEEAKCESAGDGD